MGVTAIVLSIIGLVIIIISCFMVDKTDKKKNEFVLDGGYAQSIPDVEEFRKKIDEACQETADGHLYRADTKLSQLSNEKIIAVHEFSEQVLEKIKHNHEEVVFLYNMLGEKEEELKNLMKNADRQKRQLEENSPNTVKAESKAGKAVKNTAAGKPDMNFIKQADNSDTNGNFNQKILELYSQGFTIVDISKALEIGQGEVKLVVDLFKERAKQQ